MKNGSRLATAAMVSAILCSGSAAAIEAAKDWQIKSLKGITAIQYAMGSDDPSGKLYQTTEWLTLGIPESLAK